MIVISNTINALSGYEVPCLVHWAYLLHEHKGLSGLQEYDARSNPQLILFGGATDRRHKDLRDKLVAISWRIGEKSSLSDFFEKAFYYGKM